ncbi:MAG: hypothetical protein ACRD8O_06340 [Bryobacteraceae bacterium]
MKVNSAREPELFEVMFVSRGNGRGHAVPDMAIAAKLIDLSPHISVQFVSYAEGAEAYRACGHQVLDLQAPDMPPLFHMLIVFTKLLGHAKPRLVVAHEEFPVPPAAACLGIPCIFITDFFMDPSSLHMQALQHAFEIIFTAEPGLYTEPPQLNGKVHYVGRAVRNMEYTRADWERARKELNVPLDATVVLCQPGGWTESRAPLAGLLSAAWDQIRLSPKRLIWLTGRDYETLAARFRQRDDVIILREDWKIDRLMAASDVLITKANRLTVYEAASLGLPSISISSLLNWPDDVAVGRVDSNTPLVCDSLTPQTLAERILEKVGSSGQSVGGMTAKRSRLRLIG